MLLLKTQNISSKTMTKLFHQFSFVFPLFIFTILTFFFVSPVFTSQQFFKKLSKHEKKYANQTRIRSDLCTVEIFSIDWKFVTPSVFAYQLSIGNPSRSSFPPFLTRFPSHSLTHSLSLLLSRPFIHTLSHSVLLCSLDMQLSFSHSLYPFLFFSVFPISPRFYFLDFRPSSIWTGKSALVVD